MHLTSSTVRKNEDLLKEQLNKIERLESQQKNYFSNTAHELKTPLTLISGHADFLMKNYGQDEKISKSLRNIKKNTHHLMDFTNQILNIIKAENSTIPVNVVQFYLRDFIFETLNNFDINAANKKISFQKPVYVPNIKIISDAQKLFIVLNNLLSNAFKYTQPNGLISVNVTEVEDAIQIIIQDDGIGIKEDDLERIFELYFQTSSVDVPLLGGTGIGLAICKQYIELLEGTIEVQSKWREGSTFTITFSKRLAIDNQTFVKPFKFDKVVDNPTPAENLSAKKKLTDAKQILIVEDNLELCDFFNTFLGQKFNLDFAHHGEEALAFLETQRPDLIMSDIMMPVMDGMKLLTRLKKDDHLSNIPVLMLTAKTDSFAQAKALRIGVDDYLLKPFDSDVLVAHIDNLLELADNRINNKHLEEETETDTEATVTIIEEPSYEATETAVVKEKKSVPIISREDKLWLAQFEELIGKSITDINLDLDKIANEMAISKTHLNRKVNSILGITPKRYIREVRLNKGKQMLEDREYDSVKAVAYSVGFRSDKVFSRNFKARFGKYPSEYLV
ncbi:MAG: response regulator [Saprospiraceae bacterium]